MRKGVTAASPFTAPVLRAAEILPSLYLVVVALQDLTLTFMTLTFIVCTGLREKPRRPVNSNVGHSSCCTL